MIMVITWTFLLVVFSVVSETECEITRHKRCCKCVCIDRQANCSSRSLEYIPVCSDIDSNITIFFLDHNKIKSIEEDSLERYRDLSKLDLSQNGICYIHPRAFQNLRNLSVLYLHQNYLLYNVTVYNPNMFERLTMLVNLTMYDNNDVKKDMSLAYPDNALGKLRSLEQLCIDGLENETFGIGFSNLTKLTTIRIQSTRDRCNMVLINMKTFKYLLNLKEIRILNCDLKIIEPETFKYQTHLNLLDLSDNTDLGLDGITNATADIHHTLETLILSRIVPRNAFCIIIPTSFSENLRNTSLRILIANDNRIEAFQEGAILFFPKTLQKVYMRGHNLHYGKYVSEISSLRSLIYIDLTGKDVRNFNYFQINVHANFKSEQFDIHQGNTISEPVENINLPPNLKTVTFAYGQMYYDIGRISFGSNKLETINVSRNLLSRWLGPVTGLEGIKHIDLSFNFAHAVSKRFFQAFPLLKTLDLSFNLLGNQISNMEEGNIFETLANLIHLDLTQNYIEMLPHFIFSNLSSLKTLILTKNRIHSPEIQISGLNHLNAIQFQDNTIQWLTNRERSQIDEVAKYSKIQFDLSGNPIACTCDNLLFLKWMLDSITNDKIDFGNLSEYYCYYSSGKNETLQHFEDVYNHLTFMCNNYVGIFIGISCAVLFTLCITVMGIIYRYRWKLRYLYYAARYRLHNVTNSKDSDHEYLYDAFVSFCDEDRDFVVNDLSNKLETESNLKLNLHQRNFTPGRPIAENIIEAVQTSKRTLLLLSRNFQQSYWCMYELQMANMESVTTGRDVLLIVMMEDIPTRDIPTQILYHIQTDSYIQYPSEGLKDMFWKNLIDALRK